LPERLDGYFARYAEVGDFAGVAIVAQGSSTLFEKAYGKVAVTSGADNTPNTRFRVASVSKAFTGAAVAMLASSGKLSLDDRLAKYLPTFPRADAITLRHLLLHRSGVGQAAGADVVTRCLGTDEILQHIARAPRLFEPGTSSSYSNEGVFILAVVVEKCGSFAPEPVTSCFPMAIGKDGGWAFFGRIGTKR
jgi:CubicO group peptidase (beta-lactamase class C family)